MRNKTTLYLVRIAMMGALSFALMFVKISSYPPFGVFFKFELSNVPVLLVALAYGPWHGVLVALVKNLLYLPFDMHNMGVGVLSSFILAATYSLVSGYIYKPHKSRKGAIVSLAAGSVAVTGVALLTNWFIIFPLFKLVINFDAKATYGAYILYGGVLPHNATLTVVVAIVTFFVYKSISKFVLKDTFFGLDKKPKPPQEEETAEQ